jgi:TetR/AcrR family transcriptional repressor of multidrug resistance operon
MTAPVARRRDGEQTRQKLLRSALELFTANGFRATTTPEIASRAGVAEGTIYRHFTGKEHLLNETYRSAQRWATTLIADVNEDRTLVVGDRLQRLGRRLFEAADRDPAALRMLFHPADDRNLDDKSREAAREFRAALEQIVAMGKSDGVVRPGPADLWAAIWLSIVEFAATRVTRKQWTPEHPQALMALEAAWDAISCPRVSASPAPERA